jgi:hypothetical protein
MLELAMAVDRPATAVAMAKEGGLALFSLLVTHDDNAAGACEGPACGF